MGEGESKRSETHTAPVVEDPEARSVCAPGSLLVLRAEPPLETHEPRLSARKGFAGGMPAIVQTTRHAVGKMGPVRALRTLLRVNQKGGFDCQSCAWPDDDHDRDVVAFCENGAKAVADEAMTARITEAFFAKHSVEWLGEQTDHWLNRQGRLTHPMVLREGATHYAPISWDDAFALIASELAALSSPDEAVFYTSGRTSNEAAFLYQLYVRQLGTNNLPDCSNMCHESSGFALSQTIGIGKGTVTLDDFDHAELVIIIGQNPGTNHPRMLTALQRSKRRGTKVLSINPLPEAGLARFKHPQEVFDTLFGAGTQITDLLLQAKINSDMAVLQGIMKELLLEEAMRPGEVIDREFIAAKTEGYPAFVAALEATSWEAIAADSGLTRAEIRAAAEMVMAARKIIVCWAMGLTQSPNAVSTIQEVVNLVLLKGSIGKQGSGLCPVRGHSNVQGDRTMGVWERPSALFLDALGKEFGFAPPRNNGFDVVESIRAMAEGRAKVFFAMGGNFLSATPDTQLTAQSMQKLRLTAHVSTKLNRSHLVTGRVALILPCLGRTEVDSQSGGKQFVSCENSMGVVQSSEGRLRPASEHLLSEPAIVARLAVATLGSKSTVDWMALAGDYDRIRAHIERVIPGFERYNARVRDPGGFHLPNEPREGRFPTPSRKAHFTAHALPERCVEPGQLVMMTVRTHDQFNTTIYGHDDRYRGVYGGRRVIFMNVDDISDRGLVARERVDITSVHRGVRRTVRAFEVVPFPIPRGNVATYFPETNPLVPLDSVAATSNTPTSKYVIVEVEKSVAVPTVSSRLDA